MGGYLTEPLNDRQLTFVREAVNQLILGYHRALQDPRWGVRTGDAVDLKDLQTKLHDDRWVRDRLLRR